MKGNTTGLVLLGLTLISAICTVAISIMTLGAMNQQQHMENEWKKVVDYRDLSNAVIEDASLYSRKNPTIIPLLEKYGYKVTAAAPSGK